MLMMAQNRNNSDFIQIWMTCKTGENQGIDLQRLTKGTLIQRAQHRRKKMFVFHPSGHTEAHSASKGESERSCQCLLELHAERGGPINVMPHSGASLLEGLRFGGEQS